MGEPLNRAGQGVPMKTTSPSRPLTLVHDSIEAKLAPLKILVIDDQSTGRIVLSEIMRSLDASLEVATFADPLEGIEYARKHPVDMVLTDYKMPSLDGIEVIRRLRRIFGYEDVPIVCITVVNDREVRYRALEAEIGRAACREREEILVRGGKVSNR